MTTQPYWILLLQSDHTYKHVPPSVFQLAVRQLALSGYQVLNVVVTDNARPMVLRETTTVAIDNYGTPEAEAQLTELQAGASGIIAVYGAIALRQPPTIFIAGGLYAGDSEPTETHLQTVDYYRCQAQCLPTECEACVNPVSVGTVSYGACMTNINPQVLVSAVKYSLTTENSPGLVIYAGLAQPVVTPQTPVEPVVTPPVTLSEIELTSYMLETADAFILYNSKPELFTAQETTLRSLMGVRANLLNTSSGCASCQKTRIDRELAQLELRISNIVFELLRLKIRASKTEVIDWMETLYGVRKNNVFVRTMGELT